MSWDAIDVIVTLVIKIDRNNISIKSFRIVKAWFLRTNFQRNNV